MSALLRQLFLRPPGRLAAWPEPPLASALAEWRRLEGKPAPPPADLAPGSSAGLDDSALAALATHLWRARQRLAAPADDEPAADLARRAGRHVEAAAGLLAEAQVVTKDWIRQPYDPGLPLRVLAFQPMPGLARDTIAEVVRPAVFRADRLLQPAEVVVGTPAAG